MNTTLNLPDGFERMESGRVTAAVKASEREALVAAGLLDEAGFERLCSGGEGLGSGRGGGVRVRIGGVEGAAVIRRGRRGGLLGGLLGGRYLSADRPFRELAAAEAARAGGVRVPEYLAVRAVQAGFGFRFDVIMREVSGAVSLEELLRRGMDGAALRGLVAAVADAFARLVAAGVYHPDLHAGNILVASTESGPQIYVIDFDRAEGPDAVTVARRERMLFRFNRGLVKRGLSPHPVGLLTRVRFCRLAGFGSDAGRTRKLVRRCSAHLRLHAWHYG